MLVLFTPLGAADQALLLGIPTGKDDGPVRTPSLLQQLANSMDAFQHRSRAAIRINRAVHPGIAMVAYDHPFVGILRARDLSHYIPDGPVLVVLFQMYLHLHRPGADVVREGQSSLPFTWRLRPAQVLQDGLGITV